jgi:hypothetical protein
MVGGGCLMGGHSLLDPSAHSPPWMLGQLPSASELLDTAEASNLNYFSFEIRLDPTFAPGCWKLSSIGALIEPESWEWSQFCAVGEARVTSNRRARASLSGTNDKVQLRPSSQKLSCATAPARYGHRHPT